MAIYQSKYTGKQIDEAVAKQAVLAEKIEDAVESQKAMAEQIEKNHQIAIRNSKQIENLKQGTADQFETDTAVAYVKNVPENALLYAEIKKIGGMTRKCTNLLDLTSVIGQTNTANGSTLSYEADGGVKGSGTASGYNSLPPVRLDLPIGKYTFSISGTGLEIEGVISLLDENGTILAEFNVSSSNNINKVINIEDYPSYSYATFYAKRNNNTTLSGTAYFMLNEGSTALPYEPYYEGLRSASVAEVESVGANLFDIDKREFGTIDSNGDLYLANQLFDFYRFEAEENTQYTLSAYVKNMNTTGNGRFAVIYTDGSSDNVVLLNRETDWAYSSFTTAAGKTVETIRNYFGDSGAWLIKGGELMINKGTVAKPYAPYVKHTLPIPEAVRPANGINENVYDYIEWTEDGSVKKAVECGVVDLRELYWEPTENAGWYNRALVGIAKMNVGLCDTYTFIPETAIEDSADKTIQIRADIMFIKDASITDASQITGTLIYGLAAPTTEDISDLITADNLIEVEGGGTLTFESEHKYAVPSEVEYQVEV